MSDPGHIVVVGAGPAGIRAVEMLVAAGLRPTVIDENARWGGQIYRQPPANAGFTRAKSALYGFEASKADALHRKMQDLLPHVDYLPNTLVWACEGNQLRTFKDGELDSLTFSHLVIASGATDRVFPLPGWTLPGVFTLGASQVALKAQGCVIGERIVLAGTGPLLYLVAYQYVKAGAKVAAVLDTSPFMQQVAATPKLLSQPITFAKGLYYLAWLKKKGVRIEWNSSLVSIDGENNVEGIRWTKGPRQSEGKNTYSLECDGVAIGFGLRPETQLADLAGCEFAFNDLNKCWLPTRDEDGRTSVPGVYIAGDGGGIAGADAAEIAGRLAGLALVKDIGAPQPEIKDGNSVGSLKRQYRKIAIFREGIERAFGQAMNPSKAWPDSMLVCRCEEIAAGTLRQCIRDEGASEINRLKALTRVGMGRCQGRMCSEAAIALLSAETGQGIESAGRLRAQAPIKPIVIPPYKEAAVQRVRSEDGDE